MSKTITNPNDDLLRLIVSLKARVELLERAPTGRNSIGVQYLLPNKKAGTPSDADYPASAIPPIGTIVYDTTNSKIWVRHAVGTWKGVVVA